MDSDSDVQVPNKQKRISHEVRACPGCPEDAALAPDLLSPRLGIHVAPSVIDSLGISEANKWTKNDRE
ncbi:hypothetical protein VTI74DRAFT_2238 [Chaetomium olivicolor]